MYKIYKITNKINGKIYIGQTHKSVESRFEDHIKNAETEKQYYLSKAIRKYNKENFSIETIDYALTKTEINEKEIYWIKELKANNRLYGYNMTAGGEGGNTYLCKTEEEIKQKISKNNKGKLNGNHNSVYMKNIQTGEIILFGSGNECGDYLTKEFGTLNGRIYFKGANQNKKYGIQSIFKNKYVFYYEDDELGRITNYQSKQGKMPHTITNVKTGETFIGISKEECLDYFNLSQFRNKWGNIDVTKYGFILKIYEGKEEVNANEA